MLRKVEKNEDQEDQVPRGASAKYAGKGQDTAVMMVRDIQRGLLDPKALSREHRLMALVVLADGRLTSSKLAQIFGVSRVQVGKDLAKIRANLGRRIRLWSTDAVVGQLAVAQEELVAKAIEHGDYATAWSIQKDFALTLEKLGVLGQEQKSGFKVTIEALGSRYQEAAKVLGRTFDLATTGEEPAEQQPRLALSKVLPSPPGPPPVIRVEKVCDVANSTPGQGGPDTQDPA